LQQKKIQGLKQKNYELTGTKMMFKPKNKLSQRKRIIKKELNQKIILNIK
jgi:hypothetical protein